MPARLPEFYAITAPLNADGSPKPFLQQAGCRDWLMHFSELLDRGLELIQLRAKSLTPSQLEELAAQCRGTARSSGARLTINGHPDLARRLGLDGVHLTSEALMATSTRPLPPTFLVGASCHTPAELAHAEEIGADFACLSPIRPLKGYGAADALGFEGFGRIIAGCRIPVYALGGLRQDDLVAVQNAGGVGIAGISAFWSE